MLQWSGEMMAGLVVKSVSSPEDVRPFKDALGQPVAGTDTCTAAHVGYVISGQMTIRMDDGQEAALSHSWSRQHPLT